jgi:hypothetical protein
LHGTPEKGKSTPKGNGKGKEKGKVPSAVAISVCGSGGEQTGQFAGVALAASENYNTD